MAVNEYEIGGGGKFGGEGGQAADSNFDFRIEGLERVAGRDDQGGRSPASDGLGCEGKQYCRIGIGDEQDSGAGWNVGNGGADGADYVDPYAGRDQC